MTARKKRAAVRDVTQETLGRARGGPFPRLLLPTLALCLLTLAGYSNSFHGDFTLDSTRLLRLDNRIHQVTARNVDQILHHTYWWPYGETGLYRPLSTLSYMFNYAVLGNAERWSFYIFSSGSSVNQGLIGYFEAEGSE